MMRSLPILIAVVAQVATPARPPASGDVCAAIARAVASRMGAAARVTACDAPETPGRWIEAAPDMAARIGEASWFTLTGERTGTRVKATVDIIAPHVRAAETLARGRVIAADDVTATDGPATGARFARLLTPNDVTGARVTRPIDAGSVLQAADVAIPPLVKAGEPVTAVVRIGAVEVTAAMTAIDGGSIGDEIRIALADRKRMLRGRIVGPGRVEVMNER